MKAKLLVSLALTVASSAAMAQQVPAGLYLGAGLGQSRTSFNSNDFAAPAGTSRSDDKTDTAWKLFGGYNFTRNWAVELGYVDLGEPSARFSNAAGVTATGTVENRAWFIAGKGTLPIANQFGVFGKLGLARKKSEANFSDPANIAGGSFTGSKSRNDFYWGLGAEYSFNRNVGLRLEYEDFGKFGDSNNTGSTKTKLWSASVTFAF